VLIWHPYKINSDVRVSLEHCETKLLSSLSSLIFRLRSFGRGIKMTKSCWVLWCGGVACSGLAKTAAMDIEGRGGQFRGIL
jgi:hypothetical protein